MKLIVKEPTHIVHHLRPHEDDVLRLKHGGVHEVIHTRFLGVMAVEHITVAKHVIFVVPPRSARLCILPC